MSGNKLFKLLTGSINGEFNKFLVLTPAGRPVGIQPQ